MNRPGNCRAHRPILRALAAALFCLAAAPPARAAAPAVRVWTADPLDKIFRDSAPADSSSASDDVARGQTATFQIVVRSDAPVSHLRCAVSAFTCGAVALGAPVRARFVGYVPVPANDLAHPPADRPRKTPFDYPDPLLTDTDLSLAADQSQPLWITLKIPLAATPGVYHATASFSADDVTPQPIPLTLTVRSAKVESVRLQNSNLFHLFHGYGWTPFPARYSPGYWALLRTFARNMAEHRQTVARTVPLLLADYSWDAAGDLHVDFAHMDRWMQIFREEGIARFEGQQFAWRRDKWDSPYVVSVFVPRSAATTAPASQLTGGIPTMVSDPRWVELHVPPDSPQADRFYSQFLPQLQVHLESAGLLDTYLQHVGDEPIDANIDSYGQASALVHRYAPRLRRIDARLTIKGAQYDDVLVPLLDGLHKNFPAYQKLQHAGQELWFYTCVNPQDGYANRFVELPLIKTRVLFWIAYRYHLSGYLHWGYDYWARNTNPFTHPRLPVGDANVVYPGPNFTVLDSIRWEAQRDGLEDNELLCQLADKDPAAADRIAQSIVLDLDRYDTDLGHFRAARRELLDRLDAATAAAPPSP